MVLSRERVDLHSQTDKELQLSWDKADDAGDEVVIPGIGSVTKGDIYAEISQRAKEETNGKMPRRSVKRFAPSFRHPIDGSYFMSAQNKRGMLMARSRK